MQRESAEGCSESYSLLQQVTENISEFQNLIKNFSVQAIQNASKSKEEDMSDKQNQLIHLLDPIFEVDKKLKGLLELVNEQQHFTQKLEEADNEIDRLEGQVKELQNQYFAAFLDMEDRLSEEKEKLKILKSIKSNQGIDIHSILDISRRITLTSRAPDNWDTNKPLLNHRPPYPTEDLMRASLLFRKMNTLHQDPIQEESIKEAKPSTIEHSAKAPNTAVEEFFDLDLNPDLL